MASLRQLLDRYRRKHDLPAFAQIIDATAPALMRIALHLVSDPARAEDLVQDTFSTLIQRASQFDASRPVGPWLTGILRNHVRNHNRRERRRRMASLTMEPSHTPQLDTALDLLEWSKTVEAAIEALPDAYRPLLLLRLRYRLSPGEIAAVLGMAPGTVRSYLHRGLTMLRERLPSESKPPLLAALPLLSSPERLRAKVLSQAQAAAPIGAGTSLIVALSGVTVMAKIVPWLACLAVSLLLLTGLLWSGLLTEQIEQQQEPKQAVLSLESEGKGPTLDSRETGTAWAGRSREASGSGAPIDLDAVDRSRDLHGRILTETGAGIPGALLRVTRLRWSESGFFDRTEEVAEEVGRVRSRSDGSFVIRLTAGSLASLRVEADGYASATLIQLQPGERVDVTMQSPATLELTVLTMQDEPVANAQVELRTRHGAEPLQLRERGQTSAQGLVRFEGLPPKLDLGVITRVRSPGIASPKDLHTFLRAGSIRRITVRCPPGSSIRGYVLSDATGQGIAGARVRGGSWRVLPAVTGQDGGFELFGFSGETERVLTARATGHAQGKTYAAPSNMPVRFRLARAARIVGSIVDLHGKPIGGAMLNAVGADHGPLGQRLSSGAARTDEDGRFEIDGLNSDMPHTLVVAAAGFGRRLFDLDQIAPRQALHAGALALGPAHTVQGVVLDSEGKPARRVEVLLKGANTDRAEMRSSGKGVSQERYGDELYRGTDDLGRFLFPAVSEGLFLLTAGRGPNGKSTEVQVVRGSPPSAIEIRLGETRQVEIRVLGDADAPVAGVHLSASSPDASFIQMGGTTNARGILRFSAPLAEKLQLQLHLAKRPFLPIRGIELASHATELTIRLKRAAATTGRLVNEEGKPIPGAMLVAWQGEKCVAHAHGDKEGNFSFSLELGSVVSILFEGSFAEVLDGSVRQGMLPSTARCDDVLAGTTGLRLVTRKDLSLKSLHVRVLTPGGKPMEHCYVSIGERGVPTDREGWARVENLGQEAVEVRVSDTMLHRRPFLNPEPQTLRPACQEVVFRMRAAHTIDGIAMGPASERVSGGQVRAIYAGQVVARGSVLSDGRFRLVFETTLEQVDELRVEHKLDGVHHQATLANVAAGTRDVRLHLRPVER